MRDDEHPPTPDAAQSVVPHVLAIALLLLIGSALRLHRLEELPPRLSADEYTTALDVFAIAHGGGPPLFGLDWKPMPALTAHASAALIGVTGPTIFGLRALSIGLSLLAGVLLFVLLRQQCAGAVAWSAALLLLANPWFLNFSRSNWENAHVGAYWLLFSLCALRALQARRGATAWAGGAGLALALSLYGYFSGRLLLVAWALYAPLAVAIAGWRRAAVVYAVVLATAAALFAPQVPVIARDWEHFQQRVANVSVLNADPAAHGFAPGTTRLGMAAGQLATTLHYLVVGAPLGKVHYGPPDRPPYHWLLVPLLLLGLGRSLQRWREGAWYAVLFFVVLIATQGLSVDAPDLGRLAGAAPLCFWFIGYGADGLLRRVPTERRRLAAAGVVAGALLLSGLEWRAFTAWMADPGVANARGGGVDYRDYPDWQAMQYSRLAAGQPPISVIEWEALQEQHR
ncbi:MAG: glycosyltransferase family 39 protein [Deltaproteobacteria bacterium]|nr:glycosyltransferase family 39 protein [Deltaproteobacteria bacterium]